MTVLSRVLVANRGEIAVRILRTIRTMGLESVAVYSDADVAMPHVGTADLAVRLGGAAPGDSYLHVGRIIEAALATGADALHPGYGFLAENAALARACADAGIVFVGPSPHAIEAMGDKIRARDLVASRGVPVVPGRSGAGLDDAGVAAAAGDLGLPVIIKPSAGGGGKGMRVVTDAADLPGAIASARREAVAAFGDDTLLVERFVPRPRHIEVQVVADHHGNVAHLGERECSLQRRHQKVIEECPSPFVDDELRAELGRIAIDVAHACAYTNVGTVEMIVSGDDPSQRYFMEMNTRLQVEHPVTELVYGLDLVELQLRIASGEVMPWADRPLAPAGHAIEARIAAEDPEHELLPSAGTLLQVRWPDGPVRVDAGVASGVEIGTTYDSMLAKVIAHGPDRPTALAALDRALAATTLLGVTTNVAFLRDLLADPDVRAGRLDTGLIGRRERTASTVPDRALLAAWIATLGTGGELWEARRGWRLGPPAAIRATLTTGSRTATVAVRADADRWVWSVDGNERGRASVTVAADHVELSDDDGTIRFAMARAGGSTVWLGSGGRAWAIQVATEVAGASRERASSGGHGPVLSPMPGVVVAVHVRPGEDVAEHQALAVVEAMKMEHTVVAPAAGVVDQVHVVVGDRVAMRAPIASVVARGGGT